MTLSLQVVLMNDPCDPLIHVVCTMLPTQIYCITFTYTPTNTLPLQFCLRQYDVRVTSTFTWQNAIPQMSFCWEIHIFATFHAFLLRPRATLFLIHQVQKPTLNLSTFQFSIINNTGLHGFVLKQLKIISQVIFSVETESWVRIAQSRQFFE